MRQMIMIKEYKAGEVLCAVCFKELTDPDDIHRGFHRHCKGKNGLTDNEMSSIFCDDKTSWLIKHKNDSFANKMMDITIFVVISYFGI